MRHVTEEIASQPACWRRAIELAGEASTVEGLPSAGQRVAAIGCGTSWFMAQAYASMREAAGLGETDAFAASEFPTGRTYDRLVAISRSGTTTEVIDALRAAAGTLPTTVLTAVADSPVCEVADHTVLLDFADEESVVQTRFATSVLILLRAQLGLPTDAAIADAEVTVDEALPDGATTQRQFTFLGTGWTVGLANEAALKMREASLSWTEAYPAMEYRHGPMSITDERSVVWFFGEPPAGLVEQVRAYGAIVVAVAGRDPVAELIRVQRLAVQIGANKGLDPDHPRNLTRSVVLSGE